MNSICLVTDSATQYPNPSFPGRDAINLLTLPIEIGGISRDDIQEIKVSSFPISWDKPNPPRILPPPEEKIDLLLSKLNQNYSDIIIISQSSRFSGTFSALETAAQNFSGSARILLIDSQTISIGQGFLIEQAARGICTGLTAAEIERDIRKSIPHIFNLLCTPSLSYLYHAGIIDKPQSVVSDFYNLYPLFVLEDGQFTSLIKVRNYHSALESFQEFLDEFENLKHISIIQGGSISSQDIRMVKQFCDENFQDTPFSEHQINPYLGILFGPAFLGLFISENSN
jgi:DegV family protein with EDD domain